MPTQKALALLFLLACTWPVGQLWASCCSSASSAGIGRLLPHERAYVEFLNDARLVAGSFDGQGQFSPGLPPHLPQWLVNHELHIMARLATFFLPFVKVAARTSISQQKVNSGIVDPIVGARWPIVSEGFTQFAPGIDLLNSIKIPTERFGAALLAQGLVLMKSFGPVAFGLNYGVAFEPRYFKTKDFSNGIIHTASANAGLGSQELGRFSLACSLTLQGPARRNGASMLASSKRIIALSISHAWAFHSHLTLNTALGAHIPLPKFSQNTYSEVFAQVGLRMGVF